MKTLKRIRYYSMNSWNNSTAPAYNLKIYNVIDNHLQDKVYELLECNDFYTTINNLISDFNMEHDYQWQAAFNGRSGGYLVLYQGETTRETYTEKDFTQDNGYNGRVYISDHIGWMDINEAEEAGILNRSIITNVSVYPGRQIEDNEVPANILKSFKQLAIDIIKTTEYLAENYEIVEEEIESTETIKVLQEK